MNPKKPLAGKKILVVDDEEILREVLRDMFEQVGASVVEAGDGKQAIDILAKENFDIMFSDVRMPVKDGLSLMKEINKSIKEKPLCFFCTGFSDITREEALNNGVIEVFAKPFDSKKVIQFIVEETQKHAKVS